MGIPDRDTVLIKATWCGRIWAALCCLLLSGCGLLIDAVEQVWPVAGSKVDIICERGRVQVGLAMEPFRPLVDAQVRQLADLGRYEVDTANKRELGLMMSRSNCRRPWKK